MTFSHSHLQTDRRHARRFATRVAILEAAERIVLTDGYPALTTKKLVEEAGVSERTIFNHFDTLEDVVLSRTADLLTEIFEGQLLPNNLDISELPDAIDTFFRIHIASETGAHALERFTSLAIALGGASPEENDEIGIAIFRALQALADSLINQLKDSYPKLTAEQEVCLGIYIFNLSSSIALGMGKAILTAFDKTPESEKKVELAAMSSQDILRYLREGILWAFDQVNAGKPVISFETSNSNNDQN